MPQPEFLRRDSRPKFEVLLHLVGKAVEEPVEEKLEFQCVGMLLRIGKGLFWE
jgi:hypothetical protein